MSCTWRRRWTTAVVTLSHSLNTAVITIDEIYACLLVLVQTSNAHGEIIIAVSAAHTTVVDEGRFAVVIISPWTECHYQ